MTFAPSQPAARVSGLDTIQFRIWSSNLRVRKSDQSFVWERIPVGTWEPPTIRFLERAIRPSTTFVDLGAWIGPVSLLASQRAKRVIAVEPDPVAADELEANMRLNAAPVEVVRAAISATTGTAQMFSGWLGKAGTSCLPLPTNPVTITVPAITFEDLSDKIGRNENDVAIKIDIEGQEYRLARQIVDFARRHSAAVTLSLHPGILCRLHRAALDPLRARLRVARDTMALLDQLRELGTPVVSKTGKPLTKLTIASFVFLRRKPKNFTVDCFPAL